MKKKNQKTHNIEIEALKKTILNLHGCESKWIEAVPVKETFQGHTAWEGIVEVFELIDHPKAKICYAWSYIVDESGKRKFITVLHVPPIDSPEKAVRATIISEVRNKNRYEVNK